MFLCQLPSVLLYYNFNFNSAKVASHSCSFVPLETIPLEASGEELHV